MTNVEALLDTSPKHFSNLINTRLVPRLYLDAINSEQCLDETPSPEQMKAAGGSRAPLCGEGGEMHECGGRKVQYLLYLQEYSTLLISFIVLKY